MLILEALWLCYYNLPERCGRLRDRPRHRQGGYCYGTHGNAVVNHTFVCFDG